MSLGGGGLAGPTPRFGLKKEGFRGGVGLNMKVTGRKMWKRSKNKKVRRFVYITYWTCSEISNSFHISYYIICSCDSYPMNCFPFFEIFSLNCYFAEEKFLVVRFICFPMLLDNMLEASNSEDWTKKAANFHHFVFWNFTLQQICHFAQEVFFSILTDSKCY